MIDVKVRIFFIKVEYSRVSYGKVLHNCCEKYIDMLSKGGTEDIRQILKPFNLDVSDKNFWNSGLGMIEELIDILERMC
jgi:oligoendopeptidase F